MFNGLAKATSRFFTKNYQEEGGESDVTYRTTTGTGSSNTFSTKRTKKNYEKIYREDGVTFQAINMIGYNTVMESGITVIGEQDDKLAKFLERNDLDTILLNATIVALVDGMSFFEKVYNKNGDLVRLKEIDPTTMHVVKDKRSGKVKKYVQKIPREGIEREIDPRYIVHFSLFSLPSEEDGVSLIGANIENINRRRRTDKQLAHAIERHGTPKFHVTVSPLGEDVYPDDDVWEELEKTLSDIDAKNEFITPDLVEIKSIDAKGVQGVEEYFNYFTSMFAAGMGIPLEGAGLGRGSTEATSRVRLQMFERMITAFQRKLRNKVQKEIFSEFDADVKIKFGNISVQDDTLKASWLKDILDVKPDLFSNEEIRELFGFESLKGTTQSKKKNALKLAEIGAKVGAPEMYISRDKLLEIYGFSDDDDNKIQREDGATESQGKETKKELNELYGNLIDAPKSNTN